MPQELHVLRCYKCGTFQVYIVKKTNKWQCKICEEKQSIKQVYGRGSGKDCRLHVQKLNELRLTADDSTVVGDDASGIHDYQIDSTVVGDDASGIHDYQIDSTVVNGNHGDQTVKADSLTGSKWDRYVEVDASRDDSDDDDATLHHVKSSRSLKQKRAGRKKVKLSVNEQWKKCENNHQRNDDYDDSYEPTSSSLDKLSSGFMSETKTISNPVHTGGSNDEEYFGMSALVASSVNSAGVFGKWSKYLDVSEEDDEFDGHDVERDVLEERDGFGAKWDGLYEERDGLGERDGHVMERDGLVEQDGFDVKQNGFGVKWNGFGVKRNGLCEERNGHLPVESHGAECPDVGYRSDALGNQLAAANDDDDLDEILMF